MPGGRGWSRCRALSVGAAAVLSWAACLFFGCGGDSGTNTNTPSGPTYPGGGNNCTGAGTCKTVEIGGVTWLKENLNMETANSWCYGNSPDSCAKYGRLYTWESAKSACELLGSGWHLPSRAEWDELVGYAGGYLVAGKKLRSKTGWNSYSGITNEDTYGFSALPGGYRYTDGYFSHAGNFGDWWTATESIAGNAYIRNMSYYFDSVGEDYNVKGCGYSVRCRLD